ncbi:hypothetical protein ACFL27_20365 [candidate division CSSED10-310 bacterium]|uniref:Gingipain domain-containing protein n=1 Tax=candidate division CSSED10-310 bacterium TaxID=2855610 RepID=A0ABV6Z2B6_UNCC1
MNRSAVFISQTLLIVLLFSILHLLACDDDSENPASTPTPTMTATPTLPPASHTQLVIVESGLYTSLESYLNEYGQDVYGADYSLILHQWQGQTAQDLRDLIIDYASQNQNSDQDLSSVGSENNLDGVLLIGNLPAAWYEQTAFDEHEEFPCDLYLMDPDATWGDADGDGIYDSHSPLALEIFVSRIIGSLEHLSAYFSKLHRYRTTGSLVPASAYLFKDDDWYSFYTGSDFELSSIYSTVDICEAISQTTKATYIDKLTSQGGAEFIYQWIHSYPAKLTIQNGSTYEYVNTNAIISQNFKGSFYNLFNCSASRFTQNNLAMTYILRTDSGLATHGSTKVGGNYEPYTFHQALAAGDTWGEAFKAWYDHCGVEDDEWWLGMVILGDPLLKISNTTAAILRQGKVSRLSVVDRQILYDSMKKAARTYQGETFEIYKSSNPQFFRSD